MDRKYWDKYYNSNTPLESIKDPSTFARFCSEDFFSGEKLNIVDLGCGNGRDSVYFAQLGHNVYSIDQSLPAHHNESCSDFGNLDNNLHFISGDFINYDYSNFKNVDVFYSRFTLHAIKANEEAIVLDSVFNNLSSNGIFAIEVRTINDPLFGVGDFISDTTFKTDHKRRFINPSDFIFDTLSRGFVLKYFIETNNLSIVGDDNPVLMRIVLQKIS
jgi:tellurite methyltransferase